MDYSEYRRFLDPGYIVNKPQLEICTLEITHAHVMQRALELGYCYTEEPDDLGNDPRDLPDAFLHAVIQRVFEAAGEALDAAFEDAIEDAADEWSLHREEASDANAPVHD